MVRMSPRRIKLGRGVGRSSFNERCCSMSLDILPAIPTAARRRAGFHARRDRISQVIVSVAVALVTTVAVMLTTAVGLALGLN
jgi:hypothetical protein